MGDLLLERKEISFFLIGKLEQSYLIIKYISRSRLSDH